MFGPEFAILRTPLPEWDKLGRNSSLKGFPQKDSPPAFKNIGEAKATIKTSQVAGNQTHTRAINPNNFSETDFLLPFSWIAGRTPAQCTNQNAKTTYNLVKRKQGLILSSTLDISHAVSD